MQTVEAALSLLFFASLLPAALAPLPQANPEDALYRMQLAEDAWRALYLRGDFQGGLSEKNRAALESDMHEIGGMTGFCLFISGTGYTNCRGGEDGHEVVLSMRKTVISGGVPKTVSFSLRK